VYCVVREIHRRLTASVAATHRAEADRIIVEREMAEARLQALQAQVEPHFLFNTLANVRRLYQTDRRVGRSMLDNLMRYLEIALPHMRDDRSTLGRELSLTKAFLQVHRIRMGHRLTYEIHVPSALENIVMPSMMLLTLVENAVKHGLNPLVEGGSIVVTAHVEATEVGERLVVTATDTGRGFDPDAMGTGTGLANLRARLATMRDPRARIDVQANRPRGVIAMLSLPCGRPAGPLAAIPGRDAAMAARS
jgi:sensor histidine kinase YesM